LNVITHAHSNKERDNWSLWRRSECRSPHDRRELETCPKYSRSVECVAGQFHNNCIECNSSTHSNNTPHENVYLLTTKHSTILYSRRRSNSYSETKLCQQTFVSNAYFYYYYVIIFEWRHERWVGEFIKTIRIYS